jgi:hypothetical protein
MLRPLAATAGALLLLGAGVSTASAAPTTTGTLYVQQAANASLVHSGNAWKLVLDRPDAHVIAFADRPARTGTAERTTSFVSGWGEAFGEDPPNAALQIEGAPASRDVALLELSAPKLSRGGARLTYRARPLTATSAALGGLAARADQGISGRLGRVTLFIDDGDASASQILTLSVTGMAVQNQISVGLPANVFTLTAPVVPTITGPSQFGFGANQLDFGCGAGDSTTACSFTVSVPVNLAADQPLPIVVSTSSSPGTVTASWSGGPTQTFPAPGAQVQLSPAGT